MTDDGANVPSMIRRAIGGDPEAVAWILDQADATDEPMVPTMAALLEGRPTRIGRALALAFTGRDRQVIAVASAHLAGNGDLVDVLARDHLVDHPDSFIVAWIASEAAARSARSDQRP